MVGDVNLANQQVQQLLTIEEITAFFTGDYKREIDIFDRLLHHTDNMGDYFTQGIINYITYRQQNTPPTQTATI